MGCTISHHKNKQVGSISLSRHERRRNWSHMEHWGSTEILPLYSIFLHNRGRLILLSKFSIQM
jgi:hypothetical protein